MINYKQTIIDMCETVENLCEGIEEKLQLIAADLINQDKLTFTESNYTITWCTNRLLQAGASFKLIKGIVENDTR